MNFLSDLIINPSTVGHAVGQFYVKVDALGKVVKTVDVQETDPTVSSFIKTITTGNINQWNQAFNWGNHASAGYTSGNGVSGQIAFWNGPNTITSNANFTYNGSQLLINDLSGIGVLFRHSGTSTLFTGNIGLSIRSNGAGLSSTLNFSNGVDASYNVTLLGTSLAFGPGNTERWRFTESGIFQSNGAQTIQASGGQLLTLQSSGGQLRHAGNIPNGLGNIANYSATGVLQQRTPLQTLTDIGALPFNTFANSMNQHVAVSSNVVFNRLLTIDPNQLYNPFGGGKFYDSIGSNIFAGKWNRFDVTIDGVLSSTASRNLSDQNYEKTSPAGLFGTDAGETKVININFQRLGNGFVNSNGLTYAAGFFELCFYYIPFPASWSCRVRNRDGVWTTAILTQVGTKLRGTSPIINWITDIEITLVARTTGPYVNTNINYAITQFEFHASRMSLSQGGAITAAGGYMSGDLVLRSLHAENTLRAGNVLNSIGNIATWSATGVLQQRTASEVRNDIGAQPLGNYSAVINNITQIPARSYNDLQNLPALNFEASFSKNTGFNRSFGLVVNTVAEGNDSRILNGQTAFGWGNHLGLYHLTSWTPTWEQVSGKPVFTRTLTGLVPFSGGSGTTRFLREDGNWAIPPSNGGDTTPSHVNSITTGDISKWNQAFNWGNHAGLYSLSAHSHSFLVGSGGLTTQAGSNTLLHTVQIGNPSVGLFPAIDNANSIITVNRHPGNYYSQLGFSSNGNMYFRSFSNVAINTTETWRTVWDSRNFNPNSYAIAASAITNVALTASSLTLTRASGNLTASIPTWNQNTTGNSATSTLAANSVLLAGLDVHNERNNNPNKIVRTNTSGYVDFGWINTTSGPPNSIANGLNRIYCSEDDYIRYLTPAQFSISLGLITSNNISSQSVFSSINASSLIGTGTITRTSAGTSYVNCIQVRELNNNMAQNSDPNARPQLAFHWGGIVASNIALEPSGRIAIVNNPGTGYEAFVCAGFTATTGNFSSNVNANTYDVIPGDGNGIRFWQSDNYKISMGVTSQYRYGTVTDYSIKTQVNYGSGGRGFTWGTLNNTPIASLNATSGDMQIAGSFTSLGNIRMDGSSFFSVQPFIEFRKDGSNALPISTNNLLVSNNYGGHRSRVPTNGMYVLGNIVSDGDLAAFISSDRRLKDNVLTIKDSLIKINRISGYTFDWNKNQTTYNGSDYGIIAQEIEAVFPEMVTTRENGYKAVKYDRLIPVLIEAIKELNNEVKRLKNS